MDDISLSMFKHRCSCWPVNSSSSDQLTLTSLSDIPSQPPLVQLAGRVNHQMPMTALHVRTACKRTHTGLGCLRGGCPLVMGRSVLRCRYCPDTFNTHCIGTTFRDGFSVPWESVSKRFVTWSWTETVSHLPKDSDVSGYKMRRQKPPFWNAWDLGWEICESLREFENVRER